MVKKSFRDPVTNVLKAHGYVQSNSPGDLVQQEDDSFALRPGYWRWNGASWEAYTPPLTARQERATTLTTEIVSDTFIDKLRTATPDQIKLYMQNNITDAATQKSLTIKLALAIAYILRDENI